MKTRPLLAAITTATLLTTGFGAAQVAEAAPRPTAATSPSRNLTFAALAKRASICGSGFRLMSLSVPRPAGYAVVGNYRSRNGSVSCHVIFNNRTAKQYLTIAAGNVVPGQYADDAGWFSDYAGPVKLRRSGKASFMEATVGKRTYARVTWNGDF